MAAPVPPFPMPVKVTITNPETGAVLEERILTNDYCLILSGTRAVRHVQHYSNRTHVITIGQGQPERRKGNRT